MDSYFIRVDKPNIDKKIIDSSIGVKHGDKHMIIDCPLSTNKPPEFESIEDRLEHLLFRIFNYTSKYVAVDELTGEAFHESELYTSYLRGRNEKC